MVQIYRINEAGGGEPLPRIHCADEGKELQSALEHNYDLLPGDQIRPEDPCRWLLIRREMPFGDRPDDGVRLLFFLETNVSSDICTTSPIANELHGTNRISVTALISSRTEWHNGAIAENRISMVL